MANLMLELPPDVEDELRQAAEKSGLSPSAFARQAVLEKIIAGRCEAERKAQIVRNQAARELLARWNAEDDADDSEPEPPLEIERVAFRDVRIG